MRVFWFVVGAHLPLMHTCDAMSRSAFVAAVIGDNSVLYVYW